MLESVNLAEPVSHPERYFDTLQHMLYSPPSYWLALVIPRSNITTANAKYPCRAPTAMALVVSVRPFTAGVRASCVRLYHTHSPRSLRSVVAVASAAAASQYATVSLTVQLYRTSTYKYRYCSRFSPLSGTSGWRLSAGQHTVGQTPESIECEREWEID